MSDHFHYPFERGPEGEPLPTLTRKQIKRLTEFEKYQLSFHPERPKYRDYLAIFSHVEECLESEDFGACLIQAHRAVLDVDGKPYPVMLIGQQSGPTSDYAELRELMRNSAALKAWNQGMPTPAAYEKAIKAIALACAENRTIITVIDTPGADPTEAAEAGGIAWRIGGSMQALAEARVPTVSVIINRGCSGGAIAMTGCDVVLAMEFSTYLVISPEACSSILFRTRDRANEAAAASKITSREGYDLGIVDEIVPETDGPAHRHPDSARESLRKVLGKTLARLGKIPTQDIFAKRVERWRKIGQYDTAWKREANDLVKRVSRIPQANSSGFIRRHEDCKGAQGNVLYDPVHVPSLRSNDWVCPDCGFRYVRPSAWDYIDEVLDAGSFKEHEETRYIKDRDILKFPGYAEKLVESRQQNGLLSNMITGDGTVEGQPVVFCATDFGFLGGSFAMSTGEKIWRAAEVALKRKVPMILQASGGGARMHEGCSSMVSIPKVHVALSRLERALLPVVTIITDPTLGGVAIGYGSRGVRIFEKNAGNIGFSGRRVIEQYTGLKLGREFQTTGWLQKNGHAEFMATPDSMRPEILKCLKLAAARLAKQAGG